jgi:hypothetical protein
VLEAFVISQTLLPALLYLPGTQGVRLPIRIAAFASSLAALGWWVMNRRGSLPAHPAQKWLIGALLYLALMIFHPLTNSTTAGIAHVMLYLAVCAPVFWAPALVRDASQAERLLWLLLLCNGMNAVVGVLQVYDPSAWMPAELSQQVLTSRYGIESLMYIGASGQRILRPPGLFDSPGAVAGPAMVAVLLGVVFCAGRYPLWKKGIAIGLAFAGGTVIYLTLVRTSLVIASGMVLAYASALLYQRRATRAAGGVVLAAIVVMGAFSFSVDLGGDAIRGRVETLFEADPVSVYYATTRGQALEEAFTILAAEFPYGAGLGRWGMIHQYFRDPANLDSSSLFAELQPNAWIIDGGLVLLAFYAAALITVAIRDYRLLTATGGAGHIVAAIFAANVGTLALVFGFTPFTTQVGLQYWFLVGVLHGLYCQQRRARPS